MNFKEPEFRQISKKENSFESKDSMEILKNLNLIAGKSICLIKRNIDEGKRSAIDVGEKMQGKLIKDVRVGEGIFINGVGNTSELIEIKQDDGKIFFRTETSTYELVRDGFSGLTIENEYGKIYLPNDAKEAELDDEVIDKKFKDGSGNMLRIFINKLALKGHLLEVNGANIFRSVNLQGRFFVVAKVKNIHLPFYISSAGTSGKKAGEWYPFFGYTQNKGGWLVKGSIEKDGKMVYDSEITKMQDILNENLILSDRFIDQQGVMKGIDGEVYFDLNKHLKYQNSFLMPREGDTDKLSYEERITGYDPEKVINNGDGSAIKWIDAIIKSIK